jgi:hypothetical protein
MQTSYEERLKASREVQVDLENQHDEDLVNIELLQSDLEELQSANAELDAQLATTRDLQ